MSASSFPRLRPSRHSVRTDCQVVRERDFSLVADTITDLSMTGMLVSPADPVLTGEKLIVSFRLPGTATWIDTDAVVARVVHGRRPQDRSRGLGILFEDLSHRLRFTLERSLRRLPLCPPSFSRVVRTDAAMLKLAAAMSGQGVMESRARLKSLSVA
ncbi:MAG: PilZ domain-containing protein [Polyangiaceae bacterium]|nr:PilZ domain-containing protein [Polyangiaceae bacterium]